MTTPRNNKKGHHLKLISALAAIILWFYVTNISAGKIDGGFIPVKIQYRNLAADLSLVAPEKVGVKVWGGQSIKTDQIIAYVDLQGVGPGRYERSVQLMPVEGALFTKVEPDHLDVELIPQQKQQMPIEAVIVKNPAADFKVVDTMVTPDFALMQGEAEALAKVKHLVVELDLAKSGGGVVKQLLRVLPKDANNNLVKEDIKLIPSEVEVMTVVEEDKKTKEVPLKHVLTGQLGYGHKLGNVAISPQKVSVTGNKAALAKISEVRLQPVSINEHSESFTTFAEIETIKGVLIYPKQVKITVEILKEEKPPEIRLPEIKPPEDGAAPKDPKDPKENEENTDNSNQKP